MNNDTGSNNDNSETAGQAQDSQEQNSCNVETADGDMLAEELGQKVGENVELIKQLQAENADLKDKYLRALADFENLRKRSLKERSDLLKYQGEKVISDLLGVLDTIDIALSHKEADPEQIKQGVQLIQKLFVDTLAKWEVRPVSGLGKAFDPNVYEALQKVASPGSAPGTIVTELIKAYFYKDKLLRHGKVIVASEVEASSAGDVKESA